MSYYRRRVATTPSHTSHSMPEYECCDNRSNAITCSRPPDDACGFAYSETRSINIDYIAPEVVEPATADIIAGTYLVPPVETSQIEPDGISQAEANAASQDDQDGASQTDQDAPSQTDDDATSQSGSVVTFKTDANVSLYVVNSRPARNNTRRMPKRRPIHNAEEVSLPRKAALWTPHSIQYRS